MRSYLSLIPISAKVHRRQNRMTLFCIVMAVFLVTGVFSVADAGIEAEKRNTIEAHGNWHISLKDLTEEEAAWVASRKDVAAASWQNVVNLTWSGTGLGEVGERYTIDGKKTALCGVDASFLTEIMYYFSEDAVLEKMDQILLSANAKRLLGVEVGDQVTLQTPIGSCEFTVSGFRRDGRWADSNGGSESALPVKEDEIGAFIQTAAFGQLCAQETEENISSNYYIQFQPHTNIRKVIEEIQQKLSITKEQIEENNMLLMTMGFGSKAFIKNIYGIAAFLFVLVLLAGIFMISGSLNSNIAERSQFFGMMRCIGASRRQIIRFVRLEALNWCKTAIPAGIVLATVFTWGICAGVKYLIGGEFAYMPVIRISIIGMISGVLMGLLTVLLAAQSPAKRAARVSPAAAVSGSTNETEKIRHAAHTNLFRIDTALGIHHAMSAKKNLVLMTCSFALSIVMFLCFSVMIDFFNHLLPYKSYAPSLSVAADGYDNSVEAAFLEELEGMRGVKEAYGRTSILDIPASFEREMEQESVDLFSYDELQLDWLLKDDDLRKGGEVSNVYGDSRYLLTIYDKSNPLTVGDKVWIGGEELEIAGVLKNNPFSNDGTTDGKVMMIASKETCVRLTGEENYAIVDLHVTKEATDEDVEEIRARAKEQGYEFIDRRSEADRSLFYAFVTLVYGFLLIVALISALNIINSISLSVSARIRQYGAMRAVGMDGRQLTRMILAEAYTYAAFGCVFGCAIGLPASKRMHDFLITSHFGESFAWTFPVGEILIILFLVLLSVAVSVYLPSKRIRGMAVTDTINEL